MMSKPDCPRELSQHDRRRGGTCTGAQALMPHPCPCSPACNASLAAALGARSLTPQALAKLEGKVILIQAREPQWQLYLLPGTQGIELLATKRPAPDCTLSAPRHTAGAADWSATRRQYACCRAGPAAQRRQPGYWSTCRMPWAICSGRRRPNCHAWVARCQPRDSQRITQRLGMGCQCAATA